MWRCILLRTGAIFFRSFLLQSYISHDASRSRRRIAQSGKELQTEVGTNAARNCLPTNTTQKKQERSANYSVLMWYLCGAIALDAAVQTGETCRAQSSKIRLGTR